jgi:hypothetical protein
MLILLVGISFYSTIIIPKEAQGMVQNILLTEYHGTFHDVPRQKDSYFLSSFTKQVWSEEDIARQ